MGYEKNTKEFSDILPCKDVGYKKHEKLREFIIDIWRKEKDFDILIEKTKNQMKKRDKSLIS